MPESVVHIVQRLVPGAPPPAPLTKSQKKKRKAKPQTDAPDSPVHDATTPTPAPEKPIEQQPETTTHEQPVRGESVAPSIPDDEYNKSGPITELLNKRTKAMKKKIARVTVYNSTDPEKLDNDQKRIIKTLPTLEALYRELEEVKKAVQVREAELAQELVVKHTEVEKAKQAEIADAVSATRSNLLSKTADILNLLRLRTSLASGDLDPSTLSIVGAEASAIYTAADALLNAAAADDDDSDQSHKYAAISSFFSGQGEFEGVSVARLIEIVNIAINPPRAPTPEPEPEPELEPEPVSEEVQEDINEVNGHDARSITHTAPSEPDMSVAGLSAAGPPPSGFHFMQASELEGPFEDGPESQKEVEPEMETQVYEPAPLVVNGHHDHAEEPSIEAPSAPAPIDWAAEDGQEELPSISGLQAEFGTSGSATPAEQQAIPAQDENVNSGPAAPPRGQATEDDGFTQAGRGHRGHQGHGRGRGFRGERRGGYRGGDRGGFRGGFRGEGGFRGGEGGFRGDRGRGFRGGRGEWRGDSEGRGRGRGGRGRGGYGGGQQNSAQAHTAAPAAAT